MKRFLSTLILVLCMPLLAHGMIQFKYEGELPAGEPTFIAVSSEGKIFTTQKNKVIQVYSKEGALLKTIGGKDPQWKDILSQPSGLAFYKDKLYVADEGEGHIVILSKDGDYIETFGEKGSGNKQFSSPQGLFVYRGVLYVADKGNSRVQVLGPNGVYLGQIGAEGAEGETLGSPVDVAVDYRGYIYVVDEKAKGIMIYRQNGAFFKKLDVAKKPTAIAMDWDGFYIADEDNYNISKFDFSFVKAVSFGTKGKGRGQFRSLEGLSIDNDGRVYVSDPDRKVLQLFLPERIVSTKPAEYMPPPTAVRWISDTNMPEKSKLTRVLWDKKDTLYAIDDRAKAILQIKDGKITKQITIDKASPEALDIDQAGNVWMLDSNKKRIIKIKPDGTKLFEFGSGGSSNGQFSSPSDIVINSQGIVYVADKGNKRIQIFSPDGVFIRVIKEDSAGQNIFKSPYDLAVDKNDNIYVLDSSEKMIFTINVQNQVVAKFGGKVNEKDIFEDPVSISVTESEIFVLDAKTKSIKAFTHKGIPTREFCAEGKGKGDFDKPVYMAIRDNIGFFVADEGTNRIQELITIYTPKTPVGTDAIGGTRNVRVKWAESPESYIEKFLIYKSQKKDGEFTLLNESDRNYFLDNEVEPDIPYFYRVSAVAREGNESLLSDIVQGIPTKYKSAPPVGVKAEPQEWSVDLSWEANKEDFLANYVIYRKDEEGVKEVAKVKQPPFRDSGLDSDTEYIYYVSAVSTDLVESNKTSVKFKTLVATRPPLEIDVINMDNIFSNTYKIYEEKGIGRIKVINNTRDKISKLKVAFTIKEFMDFASETEIENLPPGESREFTLKSVFNNKILDVTEDTPVQTEITVSYYANAELKKYSKNHTINIYEKHKMMWTERERVAAFVTTKDPALLEFTRDILTQYGETNEPLLYAAVLFDSLGVLGMTYMQDPTSPYQMTSGKADYVDFLQYPRETLKHKSGDCDDLVILFSAALESFGIRTKMVDFPGHLFMMFSVGKESDLGNDTMDDLFVIEDGYVWVPLEVTKVGKPFLEAWEVGSKNYYEWKDRGLGTMDLRDAWAVFKPANLPIDTWRPERVSRETIESTFNDEFKTLRKIRVKIASKKYLNTLMDDPKNVNAYLQLGIVYAEAGETGEARRAFDKALEFDPANASAKNNLGNINFIEDRYQEALIAYEEAAKLDPKDPMIFVNITRTLLRLDRNEEAKKTFKQAYELDNTISKKFRGMSLKLLGPM